MSLELLVGVALCLQAITLFYVLLLVFQRRVGGRKDGNELAEGGRPDSYAHGKRQGLVGEYGGKAGHLGCHGDGQVTHRGEGRPVSFASDSDAAEERRHEEHGDHLGEHCCCGRSHAVSVSAVTR